MIARPPRLAEWLVACSLRPSERDVVLGDLLEELGTRARRSGAGAARRWYWRQAATSLLPNLRRRSRRPRTKAQPQRGMCMEAWLQDLRYAARMIARRPLISAVALLSLGTGIALSTVVFSLYNAVVLRPLPIADPDALGLLLEVRPTSINHQLPYPDFVDYRGAQQSFTDLAAYSARDVKIQQGDAARVVRAETVSGSYFEVVGAPIRAGRPLTEADDRQGAPPVVVVSEALWGRLTGRAAGDFAPATLTINSQPFDIVGVVAAPFRGMEIGQDVSVWLPLHAEAIVDPAVRADLASRRSSWLSVIGRLAPGVTHLQATTDMNRLETALAPTVGRTPPRTYTIAPGRQGDSSLPHATRQPLRILLGAAILVLLVSCANVANLLIARGTERAREMAVRAALGAAQARLARLMLLEALLLGSAGAALALTLAPLVARRVVPFMGDFGQPVTLDVPVDWLVILFGTAAGLGTAVLAGIAPVLTMQRTSTPQALADSSRGASAGRRTSRIRQGLVVVQFALSLALVVVAVLLTRTVYNLQSLPTGLDVHHVALLSVQPDAAQYDAAQTMAYVSRAVEALSAVPGVRAAAFARVPPLGFGGSRMTVSVPGYSPQPGEDMELNVNRVTPGYAEAVGLELLAGRFIEARDAADRPPVVVINETMARRYWQGGLTVGRGLRFGSDGPDAAVIGVVRDVKYRMLREEPRPSFYVPLAQMVASDGVFHVRTSGDPQPLLEQLRQALRDVDPAVPVTTVRTLGEQMTVNVTDERLAMLIALVLGGVALLLAAIGLYASMSYVVGQRSREIGVRVALGATAAEVRRLVLGQGVRLAVIGALAGTALAVALAQMVQSRLYGVAATDIPTLAVSALVLAAIALVASDVPARRAARIDPVEALREQ